jgi:hypothetical protein
MVLLIMNLKSLALKLDEDIIKDFNEKTKELRGTGSRFRRPGGPRGREKPGGPSTGHYNLE